jgi:proteic killer suppression protein
MNTVQRGNSTTTSLVRNGVAEKALTRINALRYYAAVILSFACGETERIFRAETARRIPPAIQRSARRKLLMLHAATELRQMAVPPGNRLEALKGNLKGRHSIRINDQWRIVFRWLRTDALDVEIVD